MRTRVWAIVSAACFGAVLLGAAPQGYAEGPRMDLKKIAEQVTRTVNTCDPVAITNLYTQDAVIVQSNEPQPIRGRAAILKSYQGLCRAFPDMKVEWSKIIFSEDTIVFEGVNRGTFSGPLATPEGDVAPTGRQFQCRLVFLGKFAPDGLMAEDRTYFDNLDFMKQLGLMK